MQARRHRGTKARREAECPSCLRAHVPACLAFPRLLYCTKQMKTLRLGHSPDPDDAFMFYALAKGLIDTGPYQFEHVLQDIRTLNQRAMRGELEITAISIHAYPFVADKYALTSCGSSMGDKYGPMVVARQPMRVEDLEGKTIAIPGELTTAFLALQLCLGKSGEAFHHQVV